MKQILQKENLAYLCGSIRRKETLSKNYILSFVPFDVSLVPDNEKWEYLKNIGVRHLIETKQIPSFALEQDYEHLGLTYTSFETLENRIYEASTPSGDEKIIVFNNAFDKIILPTGYREKIIEVVGQLKDSKKIFEEWGLDEKIQRGRGVNLLFSGASGTGKTYCGEVIAEYLGTEFNIVSVANLESKWVGESEKNISNIFKQLSGNNQVLILDEVDSWLSSRSNNSQEYYSKLTNQFLIELERHNGICVMTTNRPVKLDKALQRRIDLTLDFPNPDVNARKKIWEYMIPSKLPIDGKLKYEKLASYDLNGGLIKNAILSAARKAINRQKHVTQDIIIEAIMEELKESQSILTGKDHS